MANDEQHPSSYQVPEGWEPRSWVHELRVRADRCEELHPERADYFRTWAKHVESEIKPEGCLRDRAMCVVCPLVTSS